ncbi:hypothetical protein EAX61_08930 [Dokdonia sinensis]|uniref:TerB family tellurite resistance protein n=1 Tax=Dokdonia sinensis TaxID=2479847 RepID=A0A3M0G2H7_9FLAO|nr:hypothetical protein [Dokdonia sinensis]RMB59171.1 hypothetical protein EAX61_08930 [Dokdonia sinensis]
MNNNQWTKEELKIYTLLLCAKADNNISKEQLDLIKSKVDTETFEKMHQEILKDSQDEGLYKIQKNVSWLHYTAMELGQFKKEVHQVFMTDNKMMMRESIVDEILDNILY